MVVHSVLAAIHKPCLFSILTLGFCCLQVCVNTATRVERVPRLTTTFSTELFMTQDYSISVLLCFAGRSLLGTCSGLEDIVVAST